MDSAGGAAASRLHGLCAERKALCRQSTVTEVGCNERLFL